MMTTKVTPNLDKSRIRMRVMTLHKTITYQRYLFTNQAYEN
jgi:hypothetical protein